MIKTPLTPGFFQFALGFSIIILISFGLLIFLSTRSADTQPLPTPDLIQATPQ